MARVAGFHAQANRKRKARKACQHVRALLEPTRLHPAFRPVHVFFSQVHRLNSAAYLKCVAGPWKRSSFPRIFHELSCWVPPPSPSKPLSPFFIYGDFQAAFFLFCVYPFERELCPGRWMVQHTPTSCFLRPKHLHTLFKTSDSWTEQTFQKGFAKGF